MNHKRNFALQNALCQVLTLVVLGLVAGCESPGRSLAKSAVDQIQDGQTTRIQVDEIFGEPKQMTKSPAGKTLYYFERFYGPSESGSFGAATPFADESDLLILTVLFDSSDVVEKHLFSHTKPDVSRRMLRAGRKLGTEDLARIVPQKTTREELTSWFGPHWSEELTLSGQVLVMWLYADAFSVTGTVNIHALQVIMDDAGKVSTFRVTRRD